PGRRARAAGRAPGVPGGRRGSPRADGAGTRTEFGKRTRGPRRHPPAARDLRAGREDRLTGPPGDATVPTAGDGDRMVNAGSDSMEGLGPWRLRRPPATQDLLQIRRTADGPAPRLVFRRQLHL